MNEIPDKTGQGLFKRFRLKNYEGGRRMWLPRVVCQPCRRVFKLVMISRDSRCLGCGSILAPGGVVTTTREGFVYPECPECGAPAPAGRCSANCTAVGV